MQKMKPRTGRVAGMDQRPVQVGRTTAHSVATSVDSVKDPTPNSFQGIDLEDMEVRNQIEGKIDSRVDLKAVDTGLGAHTDTGVADLEVRKDIDSGAHTDMKVDLGVRTGTGVDPGAHIGPGVDLEGHIVLEVAPQVQIEYPEVAPQVNMKYPKVAPQANKKYLEAAPQAVTDCLEVDQTSLKFLLHSTDYYHYFQLITSDRKYEEMLLKKYQKWTNTQQEQTDRHINRLSEMMD